LSLWAASSASRYIIQPKLSLLVAPFRDLARQSLGQQRYDEAANLFGKFIVWRTKFFVHRDAKIIRFERKKQNRRSKEKREMNRDEHSFNEDLLLSTDDGSSELASAASNLSHEVSSLCLLACSPLRVRVLMVVIVGLGG
jgi:hypothetical protein